MFLMLYLLKSLSSVNKLQILYANDKYTTKYIKIKYDALIKKNGIQNMKFPQSLADC